MAEQMEEEDARIESVYQASKYLKELLEDVSVLEHALIEEGDEKKPYEPTFFLYIFFSFNTIFNIDWSKSKEEGVIVDAAGKEEDQIKKLIDFCFSDNSFAEAFFPSFYSIVTLRAKGDVSSIHQSMKSIIVDNKRIKSGDADNCRSAFRSLLSERGFNCRNMKTLATFIYKVRCNLVHGTKTFEDLRKPMQRERILYYSFFLIALQHMLFMRLEDLRNGFFSRRSEDFILKLRSKQWLPITAKTSNNAI